MQSICEMMCLYFLFDEYTDYEDGAYAEKVTAIVMDAMRRPHEPRPKGEHAIGEIVRQQWAKMMTGATPDAQRRYIETWDRYTSAVVQEAKDRTDHRSRPIDEYIVIRRGTGGALPCVATNLFEVNVPGEVLDHPVVVQMRDWGADLVHISNVSLFVPHQT